MVDLASYIRDIPDFPKPGILFKDITPLLKSPEAMAHAAARMSDPFRKCGVQAVVGVESRGFIFGVMVAQELGAAFIPVRKPGKLPADTVSASYELEYGTDSVEIHRDAIGAGDSVLLVDDLLATGGTMGATAQLVEGLGGRIVGVSFLIELTFLGGREKLTGQQVAALLSY